MKGELFAFTRLGHRPPRRLPRRVFSAGNVVTGKGNIVASRKHAREVSETVIEAFLGRRRERARGRGAARRRARRRRARGRRRASPTRSRCSRRSRATRSPRVRERVAQRQQAVGYAGDYAAWVARRVDASTRCCRHQLAVLARASARSRSERFNIASSTAAREIPPDRVAPIVPGKTTKDGDPALVRSAREVHRRRGAHAPDRRRARSPRGPRRRCRSPTCSRTRSSRATRQILIDDRCSTAARVDVERDRLVVFFDERRRRALLRHTRANACEPRGGRRREVPRSRRRRAGPTPVIQSRCGERMSARSPRLALACGACTIGRDYVGNASARPAWCSARRHSRRRSICSVRPSRSSAVERRHPDLPLRAREHERARDRGPSSPGSRSSSTASASSKRTPLDVLRRRRHLTGRPHDGAAIERCQRGDAARRRAPAQAKLAIASALLGEALEQPAAARMAQLAQRLRLDLADPLARHLEVLPDFLERVVGASRRCRSAA